MRLVDAMRRLPKPLTAARLAEETGVSQRQLYRDIATLRAGGALIDGEAGFGYRLVEDPALPPQSFSQLEIEALGLAVQALNRIGDDELIEAGRAAFAGARRRATECGQSYLRACRSTGRTIFGLGDYLVAGAAAIGSSRYRY